MKSTAESTCKREAVLEAAMELIAENGFHGTSIALIAERAGVGAGTIYRYFSSKDEMIVELYNELHASIGRELRECYPGDGKIKSRYTHFCAFVLNYFIKNPDEFSFWEQFNNSPYGIDRRREKLFGKNSTLMEIYRDGRKSDQIKNLPAGIFIAITIGSIAAMARDHIQNVSRIENADTLDGAVEACWDAVALK